VTGPTDGPAGELRDQVRGAVLEPGDAGYADARTVWNAKVDREPAVVVRCSGAADVAASVDVAREHDLRLSVKGGGHHVSGSAVVDGGLTMDLGEMNGVRVDSDAKRARVGPGATWGDVDHETQAFGLAVPGGQDPNIGVAGLTLGGGVGWLSRKYGLTCDNLLSAEVVTADGELVRASAEQNPDLFWALRGGGGNFGVVTSFEFRLHEVGPEIFAGSLIYPSRRCRRSPGTTGSSRPTRHGRCGCCSASWSCRQPTTTPSGSTTRGLPLSSLSTPGRPRKASECSLPSGRSATH